MRNSIDWALIDLLPFWTEFFGLLGWISWPIAAVLIARVFRKELKALIARLNKVSLTGAEFGISAQQRANAARPKEVTDLKQLPGMERTNGIASVEIDLHKALENFDEELREDLLVRELAQTRLDLLFQRVYTFIFGWQIKFLKRLRDNGGSLPIVKVEEIFTQAAREFEEHAVAGMDRFMDFLIANQLVKRQEDKFELTAYGEDFLLFLYRFSLSEDKIL